MPIKNLIPVTERTEEEARKMSSNGGKASGAARRKKSSLKKALIEAMNLPFQSMSPRGAALKEMFPEVDAMIIAAAAGLMQDMIDGKIDAWEMAYKILGEDMNVKTSGNSPGGKASGTGDIKITFVDPVPPEGVSMDPPTDESMQEDEKPPGEEQKE
ncbi:MAG: hypothetical protein VB118_04745 [Oscillospiraceae bacterium]|nr:hypothetical protein [Oscillospiraceae bacterium]